MHYFKKADRYKLIFSQNGKEAVDEVKRRPVSIVLMDMEMPIMDGYTATRIIRTSKKEQMPILALTAHQDKQDHKKCLQAGCTAVVTKPIRKQQLIEAIDEYFT
ncbi:MAG: response regulator [bacterium]